MEVAHEALFREWPRLRAWLEEDAESRRAPSRASRTRRAPGSATGRARDDLYRGGRLAGALEWRDRHEPELEPAGARVPDGELGRRVTRPPAPPGRRGRARAAARGRGRGRARRAAYQRGERARRRAHGAGAAPRRPRAGGAGARSRAAARRRRRRAGGFRRHAQPVAAQRCCAQPAATWIMRGASAFTAVDTSPDGRLVAVGDETGKLVAHGSRTRRRRSRPIVVGNQPVYDVRFSPDGTRLAVATEPSSCCSTRARRRPIADWAVGIQAFVQGLAFSPDSRTLAASLDYSVRPTTRPDVGRVAPSSLPSTSTLRAPIEHQLIRWDARTGRQLDAVPARARARRAPARRFRATAANGSSPSTRGGDDDHPRFAHARRR